MKPLLLLAPMRSEMAVYETALQEKTESRLLGRLLLRGSVGGYPVAVLHTGMGLTNTALALSLALPSLAPGLVLSQGTAGGHREELPVGQFVVADGFVYGESFNDSELLPFETPQGSVTRFAADPAVMALAQTHGLPHGIFHSAYRWNSTPASVRAARQRWGSILEEMEDAAAAQVCQELGVPHGAIRVISNNELREDGQYRLAVTEDLQQFILRLIQQGELHR